MLGKRCNNCSRRLERFKAAYASFYCSEQCWYNDGCPGGKTVSSWLLQLTFERFKMMSWQ
jgi:hypothetical protein